MKKTLVCVGILLGLAGCATHNPLSNYQEPELTIPDILDNSDRYYVYTKDVSEDYFINEKSFTYSVVGTEVSITQGAFHTGALSYRDNTVDQCFTLTSNLLLLEKQEHIEKPYLDVVNLPVDCPEGL